MSKFEIFSIIILSALAAAIIIFVIIEGINYDSSNSEASSENSTSEDSMLEPIYRYGFKTNGGMGYGFGIGDTPFVIDFSY